MIVLTLNLATLLSCKRNCIWCYLKDKMKSIHTSNLNNTIKPIVKSIDKIISNNNCNSKDVILYISMPDLSSKSDAFLQADLASSRTAINILLSHLSTYDISPYQIRLLAQPMTASYVKQDRDFPTVDGCNISISSLQDIKDIRTEYNNITRRRKFKLMITELKSTGTYWNWNEIRKLANNINAISDYISEVIVEIIKDKNGMPYTPENHASAVMLHGALSGLVTDVKIRLSDCINCNNKDKKTHIHSHIIKEDDVTVTELYAPCKRLSSQNSLSIETISISDTNNLVLSTGCPYII